MVSQFWNTIALSSRVYLVAICCVTVISLVRFLRVEWRLHRDSGTRIELEAMLTEPPGAALLAQAGLANRIPVEDLENRHNPESAEQMLYISREAQRHFSYLWEGCAVTLKSIRRAYVLVAVLSVLMVIEGAYPTYLGCFNNNNVTAAYCMVVTGNRILQAASVALLMCVAIFLMAGMLDRTLHLRRISWNHFHVGLTNRISRVQ